VHSSIIQDILNDLQVTGLQKGWNLMTSKRADVAQRIEPRSAILSSPSGCFLPSLSSVGASSPTRLWPGQSGRLPLEIHRSAISREVRRSRHFYLGSRLWTGTIGGQHAARKER